MFRFLELSLHGWDLWQQFRVPLDRDVILLSGPNGSGKTTFLDAIRQLLGAQRLSSKRRLQQYLRRPDQPTLIRAVVTNAAPAGAQSPFRKERITSPEVTLACALMPSSGGSPEKRYAIVSGRASAVDLQRQLLDAKDFYAPEQYARALENAGVSRSLMAVLAIEQGSTHTLFELSPRELFRRVLEMLGDKAVLDRYTDARRRFDQASQDLARQIGGLLQQQAQLETVRRKVRELDDWEEGRAKVTELEVRLPAAQYQALYKERQETETKLRELRTKVRQGETEKIVRRKAFEEAQSVALLAQVEVTRAEKELADATAGWNDAEAKARSRADRVADLERLATEWSGLPEAHLPTLETDLQRAMRATLVAAQKREALDAELDVVEVRIKKLEAGVPAYPEEVALTLAELGSAGIETTMLCREISSVVENVAIAVEAALGDARFALSVAAAHEHTAFEIARRSKFPGPVYSGKRLAMAVSSGPVRLEPGAAMWLRDFFTETTFGADGTFADARGRWQGDAAERFIGSTAIEEQLRTARESLARVTGERRMATNQEELSSSAQQQISRAVAQEHRRLFLFEQIRDLPQVRIEAAELARVAAERKRIHEDRLARHGLATAAAVKATSALLDTQEERDELERQLEGEKTSITDREQRLVQIDAVTVIIRDGLSAELRARAEAGLLDGEQTVAADLGRAREKFNALPPPPEAAVRLEAKHIEFNIQELERHVTDRTREKERADRELLECRLRYLQVINHTLLEYKARAVQLGRGADVVVEMDLPSLRNDEQALDEAKIDVRFGFDGKETLPLGDSSFSGGQKVIAGLILLMSMAETEGGFFMLDEPFAHLSIDRVDQVGQFLRGSKAQFLITAPTTLDRAQLDPASMVIVLQKKAKGATFAPSPLVAVA